MTRCFLGFELTEDSRRYLYDRVAPLHDALRRKGRWPVRLVPPENWHATLLFFDDLDAAERDEVWQVVADGAARGDWQHLRFAWRRLALWPSLQRPSLVALEADACEAARDWPVAPHLDREPFAKADTRHYLPFIPHVTVIRFDRRWRRVLPRVWSELEEVPQIDPAAIRVHAISFLLSPPNPVYRRERTVALVPGGDPSSSSSA